MKEQTALPPGIMVEAVGLFIRCDMSFKKPGLLAILDIHIGFLDADLPCTNRLDLTPLQGETCFEFLV